MDMTTKPHLPAVSLFLLAGLAGSPVLAGDASPRMRLLMPDDFAELRLCGWRVEPATPDPQNPLIEGEMPWDRGGVGIHGSVFQDPIDNRWKAYLVCTPAEELPEKQPENQGKPWESENHSHRRVCLFESDDGVKWARPRLDNISFGAHKTTNILFDVGEGVSAYSSVLVDPGNREWPYEMFVLRESWGAVKGKAPKGNGYYRYRSKDGKKWEGTGEFVNDPMKGDLCFFYRDPEEGYVAYYRLGGPHKPTDHLPAYEDFPRRSCYRAISRDGNKWLKDPLMLLTADERDHRDTQYQECVPLRVPGGYVALVTMYLPLTQTLNLRLAASRDGRRWWFPDRRPCLDNAPLGDYGGGMIWQSQYLTVEDGKLHVYYGATEGPHRQISDTRAPSKDVGYEEKVIDHGGHFLPFNAALCRASWRADRLYALASSAGGPTLGIAVTQSRPLGSTKLFVNLLTRPAKKASAAGLDEGILQVELLDEAGKPLPGFARDDCPPLKGDHAALAVRWKGGEAAPAAARQAKFYLKRAFLYGFEFRADVPAETPEQAARRKERVAERRKGVDIICHRGASEHAHENTLEAFRATFELGGDGNEFDIRATKDGVFVVFHDDMLDHLLEAYGDVGDYSWEQLQRFRFRNPGRFGEQCRIPTLVEVFDLHRKYGGLMHLDIKRSGLDEAIADLLTRMDMWEHVGYCNTDTGGVILRDPRFKVRRYKGPGLYHDRSEIFPEPIAAALKKPGDGVIVDDPRGVAVALGRKLGKLSGEPVSPRRVAPPADDAKRPGEAELIATLRKADDWDRVAETASDQAASGEHIRARARAAEQLLAARASSKEAFAALEERVRKRSLHKDWMYHGFDGAMALRSLILLRTPNAVEVARFALWRDDPVLEPVIDPRWKNPRSWTDFRVKMVAWPALEKCPGPATEQLCRDYLALDDEDARKVGPPQFEEAARALLAVSPRTETALELMKHRLQVVRGRAVLDCLAHAREAWARAALEKGSPHALAFRAED